ncbi:hypothetical protein FA15DRAFT_737942 [Coprinopsis marcescibilis]|uniref:Protein CASP n=1 Tax=Coprinopsis marcescibilis TaxID=230819 RepID=A0A5C3KXA2_COPMA|nr:hypothetical protein FA15DRAFT_737942 [Coprinopsis marcescibilis]
MSSASNFSAALSTWQEINLTELQKRLDAQGIEVVDNQKEGLLGRKALADKTKGMQNFKKLPDDEKLNAFRGLLKSYQTEIDNITKRCKTSDNAFLNVYKVLAEAPDPYPLLEAAVDQAVKVAEALEQESELKRLREENTEMKKRISELSSLESSKKKLDIKVEQLENKMEEFIQEKVAQKANEINATYDERIRNYEEREQDLQKRVSLAKTQLRELRMSNETNQAKLFDQTQRQDQEVFSKLAEVDMIIADLDRANTRIATVERRNEILRAEIETLRSGNQTSEQVKSFEAQIADLEAESERLSRSLENQKALTSEVEKNGLRKAKEITDELSRKATEIETLKQKLSKFSDYDEIKRELEIIKFVEFSGLDDEGDGQDVQLPDPNASKAGGQHNKSLEALLASKNKRIQEELTKFRILHNELQESLKNVERKLDSTSAELEKQKDLNERLENDLLAVNDHEANGNGSAHNNDDDDLLANLDRGKKFNESSSSRSASIPFAPSADTSILPIVTSQRDRFRQRNAELEEELRKQYQTISELRAEIKSLQADNLKLYEKVRYMQSYREDQGLRSVTQLDPLPSTRSDGLEDGISKYHSRYEDSVNPFEAFRGREQTRGYQSLNPLERTVLLLTRPLAGSRRARTLFILYAMALHILVFYTSFTCSAPSPSQVQKHPAGAPFG